MWRLKTEKCGSLSPHIVPGMQRMDLRCTSVPIRKSRRSKCAPSKTKTNAPCIRQFPSGGCILDRDPDDWTEEVVYKYFTNEAAVQYPTLVEINDMLVRLHGVHKFKCAFFNKKGDLCHAWIPASILYRCYPAEYVKYTRVFFNKLEKTCQLSSSTSRRDPH